VIWNSPTGPEFVLALPITIALAMLVAFLVYATKQIGLRAVGGVVALLVGGVVAMLLATTVVAGFL